MNVFKLMRVVVLLSVLFVLVVGTWITETRMASWDRPILVTIYPIIADDLPETARFAEEMSVSDFDEVNRFFERESRPYGFRVSPALRFQLAPVSEELPPDIPPQFSTASIALWSLKMRWWSMVQDWGNDLIRPDIQMFMMYHSLNGSGETGISVGMRKGRYGLVKAYARRDLQAQNLIVFTHELLHVLGASDKYVLSTGEPLFPEGYADPDQRPLFPQTRAEIMGGRIPQNSYSSFMPRSLAECRIGKLTGEEIGFMDKLRDQVR